MTNDHCNKTAECVTIRSVAGLCTCDCPTCDFNWRGAEVEAEPYTEQDQPQEGKRTE